MEASCKKPQELPLQVSFPNPSKSICNQLILKMQQHNNSTNNNINPNSQHVITHLAEIFRDGHLCPLNVYSSFICLFSIFCCFTFQPWSRIHASIEESIKSQMKMNKMEKQIIYINSNMKKIVVCHCRMCEHHVQGFMAALHIPSTMKMHGGSLHLQQKAVSCTPPSRGLLSSLIGNTDAGCWCPHDVAPFYSYFILKEFT